MTDRTPSLMELQETDRLLDELAAGRIPLQAANDPVLGALAALATAVDDAPMPELAAPATTHVGSRGPSRSRHLAAVLAIGITLSSSGIAAAVTGDPLLPIKTVVKNVYEIGHHDTSESDWILGGRDRPHHSRDVRWQEPHVPVTDAGDRRLAQRARPDSDADQASRRRTPRQPERPLDDEPRRGARRSRRRHRRDAVDRSRHLGATRPDDPSRPDRRHRRSERERQRQRGRHRQAGQAAPREQRQRQPRQTGDQPRRGRRQHG